MVHLHLDGVINHYKQKAMNKIKDKNSILGSGRYGGTTGRKKILHSKSINGGPAFRVGG